MGCRGRGYEASERNLTYFLLCFIVVCNLPLMYFCSLNLEIESSMENLSKLTAIQLGSYIIF